MLTPRKLTDNWVLIPREQMDHAAGRDHRDVTPDDRLISAAMNANDVAWRWGRRTPLPYQAGPAGGTS